VSEPVGVGDGVALALAPEAGGVDDGVGVGVGVEVMDGLAEGAATATVPFESTSTDTGTPRSAESGVVAFTAESVVSAGTAVAFSHTVKRAWRDGDEPDARPADRVDATKSATARLVAFAYASAADDEKALTFTAAHAAGSVTTTRTVTYVNGTTPDE
jgi:hypothetical protein